MAESITMSTLDGVYTFTASAGESNTKYAVINFDIEDNNRRSDTQGFLVKVQKGEQRVVAVVEVTDTKENIEANLMPMHTYPDAINVTFDRNPPLRSSRSGVYQITRMRLGQRLTETQYEIQLELTEVIVF